MEKIDIKRFRRLRKVVQQLLERELHYELEVLAKFDTLDMDGIERLAQERQKKLELREQLEKFIEKYEQRDRSV